MRNRLKGYNMCVLAVNEIVFNNTSLNDVFEYVAQITLTTKSCVERNIRYAVEETWQHGDLTEIENLFGNTVSAERGKPTNREFLFMLADTVKRRSGINHG